MSDPPQPGGPFGFGQFDLGQLMRLLQGEEPFNFEVAHQVAVWVVSQGATDGAEPGVDPADVEILGQLTRTAQMHVLDATGLGAGLDPVPHTVGRQDWATETLGGLRPVLTTLAERLASSASDDVNDAGDGGDVTPGAGTPADFATLVTAMAPILLGIQSGFMIGHLASRVLARYETPLPIGGRPSVCYVTPNLAAFGRDWELPRDELFFYVALHESVHAATLSVEWVQGRVLELAAEYVSAFDVDAGAIEERLGGVDPSDPSSLESALGDPTELLEAIRPPRQREILDRLRAVTALVEGHADHVLERVGRPLIPEFTRIREAYHRHRVERGEAARFLEALLGFDVGRDDYDRAARFCSGVVARAGESGLGRLWGAARMLPTPAELDAPGLWLERIDLPEDPEGPVGSTP